MNVYCRDLKLLKRMIEEQSLKNESLVCTGDGAGAQDTPSFLTSDVLGLSAVPRL